MAHPLLPARALVIGSALVLVTTTVAVASVRHDPGRPVGAASGLAVPPHAPPTAITADGRIHDLLRLGDRIYVRGGFRHIGPYSGSGMPIHPGSGARVAAPQLDGQVSVSVPDGEGGWFVAGDFTKVGDVVTRGLAHLDSAGVADPDFTPRVDGLVSALALHGDTLWFGGFFSEVDGAPRRGLAAVSVTTGDLTGFSSPQQRRVTELAYAAADGDRPARVYVGTDRLVALDPVTGVVDPTFASSLEGDVRALLVDGDRILVGGRGLVALDADTGAVDESFGVSEERFPADVDWTVHTLLLDGETLYAGGDFTSLGGSPGPLVALDPTTGLGDDAFAPAISRLTHASSDRGVFDLTSAGGHLWVGGSFAEVQGQPAGNLVALDPATGTRVAVDAPVLDNAVNAVDASGDGLYVGGQFFMTDPVRSPGFAALDADTLQPIAEFDAARNGYGSMVAGDGVLYLGSTNFDGYSRYGGGDWYYPTTDRIRAVDPLTGASLPELGLRGVENLSGFTALGGELYVAQRVANDRRFPQTRVSVYSSETGELDRRFRLPLPGYVTELSSLDGRLLAAGSFRRWRSDGQRAHLAAIQVSPRDGRLNSTFDPHTHGPIGDVEVVDGELFVSGLFGKVHTGLRFEKRPGLAKYATTGDGFATMVRAFDPPASVANRGILRLVGLDDTLFVRAYGNLFLDARTGARLPDPTDGYRPTVADAVTDPGGIVYAAHTYATLSGRTFFDLGFIARAGAEEP